MSNTLQRLPAGAENWVFTLEEDFAWPSGLPISEDAAFEDKTGRRWLELRRDGTIRVFANYSWDGCTPKLFLFDVYVGIPDGIIDGNTRREKTYHASLIHDALYQFLDAGLPLSRADADRCFLKLMAETHFNLRYLYYGAVRLFGSWFRKLGKFVRKTEGNKVAL